MTTPLICSCVPLHGAHRHTNGPNPSLTSSSLPKINGNHLHSSTTATTTNTNGISTHTHTHTSLRSKQECEKTSTGCFRVQGTPSAADNTKQNGVKLSPNSPFLVLCLLRISPCCAPPRASVAHLPPTTTARTLVCTATCDAQDKSTLATGKAKMVCLHECTTPWKRKHQHEASTRNTVRHMPLCDRDFRIQRSTLSRPNTNICDVLFELYLRKPPKKSRKHDYFGFFFR